MEKEASQRRTECSGEGQATLTLRSLVHVCPFHCLCSAPRTRAKIHPQKDSDYESFTLMDLSNVRLPSLEDLYSRKSKIRVSPVFFSPQGSLQSQHCHPTSQMVKGDTLRVKDSIQGRGVKKYQNTVSPGLT